MPSNEGSLLEDGDVRPRELALSRVGLRGMYAATLVSAPTADVVFLDYRRASASRARHTPVRGQGQACWNRQTRLNS
jgi:hypothetical protein